MAPIPQTAATLKRAVIMKFQIFRTDIQKVLLTSTKANADLAFGEWVSAMMMVGFLPLSSLSTLYMGTIRESDDTWRVTNTRGETFNIEVRAIN